MITFDLAKLKKENVVISGTDEIFKGTPYEGNEFSVEVKKPSRADKINLQFDCIKDDGETIDQGKYSQELFISCIASIDGFKVLDENGQEAELTVDSHGALFIWEYAEDELISAIKNAMTNTSDEKKSEESEQDSQNMQNG